MSFAGPAWGGGVSSFRASFAAHFASALVLLGWVRQVVAAGGSRCPTVPVPVAGGSKCAASLANALDCPVRRENRLFGYWPAKGRFSATRAFTEHFRAYANLKLAFAATVDCNATATRTTTENPLQRTMQRHCCSTVVALLYKATSAKGYLAPGNINIAINWLLNQPMSWLQP